MLHILGMTDTTYVTLAAILYNAAVLYSLFKILENLFTEQSFSNVR